MAFVGGPAPSTVSFPTTESSPQKQKPVTPVRAPHLPFRRISLPTAPTLLHRTSVVSVASFDSLRENSDEVQSSPQSAPKGARLVRPTSVESPRRRNRARDSIAKPSDDRKAAMRRKVVDEFYETEKAYVEGLELVYSHFLTPIIASLDTPEPLLNRSVLTSIFSNFIDIWNLHRSFLSALTTVLKPVNIPSSSKFSTPNIAPPKLSPLLLAHFPYLSLYTPFVTSFPSTISALTELVTPPTATRPNPQYNAQFAIFLATQEADPSCGKLKLRDWLLTVVQRCPRYLLLLKDLINATGKDDPEYVQLTAVHTLVSKITLSLNTSLHTHAQTLALLALQRATPNLPFQLITPGRSLVKRGPLIQLDRGGTPSEREFLLFSDCLIWLAPAEPSSSSWDWSWSGSGGGAGQISQSPTPKSATSDQPGPVERSRCRSDAELPGAVMEEEQGPASTPVSPVKRRSQYHIDPPPPPNMSKRHASVDDKWVYKGRVELVDVEVVVGSALEDERKFDVLSPEGSFVIYAASEEERDDWTSEIRSTKAQLLVSLNVTNPNSTLTSSASTNHVRRALQALPYPPSDERLATVRASSSMVDFTSYASGSPHGKSKLLKKEKEKERMKKPSERRRKVEHWVPAIWIPDGKTSSCMRCGRMFGWRRRRHHCRLCGRCVCGGCSGRTFFISEGNMKDDSASKPARACDACYETVFPVIDTPPPEEETTPGEESGDVEPNHEQHNTDTITSLSHLPSWLSMPALPVQRTPQALMAIDLNSSRDQDLSLDIDKHIEEGGFIDERDRRARVKVRSHQRIRSYQQILEDFQEQARIMKQEQAARQRRPPGPSEDGEEEDAGDDAGDEMDEQQDQIDDIYFTPPHSALPSPVSSPRKPQRREDTARRSKRFSLPAIALHATSVTARTSTVDSVDPSERTPVSASSGAGVGGQIPENASVGDLPSSASAMPGKSKRFSLVLAGRNSVYSEGSVSKQSSEEGVDMGGLAKGVAAAKLSELLGRKSKG